MHWMTRIRTNLIQHAYTDVLTLQRWPGSHRGLLSQRNCPVLRTLSTRQTWEAAADDHTVAQYSRCGRTKQLKHVREMETSLKQNKPSSLIQFCKRLSWRETEYDAQKLIFGQMWLPESSVHCRKWGLNHPHRDHHVEAKECETGKSSNFSIWMYSISYSTYHTIWICYIDQHLEIHRQQDVTYM